MNYLDEYIRWKEYAGLTQAERAELRDMKDDSAKLQSAFGKKLTFGTAGLRGICGVGTNRMNRYTVRRASQGLAAYLRRRFFSPSVVISFDSRLESENFAREAACVLAANGVLVFIFEEMMPVPILSYAISELKCSAGIMITASHNSKEYNGYKVYNEYGGQILDREAEKILYEIDKLDIFNDVLIVDYGLVLGKDIRHVDRDLYEAYLDEIVRVHKFTDEKEINIVYTPLHGAGCVPVSDILKLSGYDFFIVPEQKEKDGNFTTCSYPNPEKEEVYRIAKRYGEAKSADILIATDPDCDRVGVMVKHAGEYRLLSGNEIGILLLKFICERGDNLLYKSVYTSLVSTALVEKIAKRHGLYVKRTPVGFKYIGNLIAESPEAFLFGFEESNGYLMGSYVKDKDGVAAAFTIVQMAAHYKAQGSDLLEVLDEIHRMYGYILDRTVSIEIADMAELNAIMAEFRSEVCVCNEFSDVCNYTDYRTEQYDPLLAGIDVVRIDFGDDSHIIIRPSGTEPKIKFYYSAAGADMITACRRLDELEKEVNAYLKFN